MNSHNLFYYPYASLTNAKVPLLKMAALYFDKLFVLDPEEASLNNIGLDSDTRNNIQKLRQAGILEIITPSTVLAKYESSIADAIRNDMVNEDFLKLCQEETRATGKHRWTLSMSKVPRDLHTDQVMRNLMGDFARSVSKDSGQYFERSGQNPQEFYEYAETGQTYDEYRKGNGDGIEYRYADYPLALGEAIMMNHALFAGLLHANATPITDAPFHSKALSIKLNRAVQEPAIQSFVNDKIRVRQWKMNQLAFSAISDTQLSLPILNPQLSLEEVLEYREKHNDDLLQAREKLGWMARQIKMEPWSKDFAQELEHNTIPGIAKELEGVRKTRDTWLKSEKGKRVLSAASIGIGAAAAVLTIFTAPLTPIALVAAGLGMISGTAIPATQWLKDFREGKESMQENGLHYLLKL